MVDAVDIPIQAWLSYRCKDALARSKRDELKQLCDENSISLVYDENDTEEGDHLITFMEDLTSARCVYILLAPNYFESAYTLFELVCIHERGDLDNRFILPMRLNEDMVTYVWTQAKTYWESNEAVRNELRRLLSQYWNVNDPSDDALWSRVDLAWKDIVFRHLDTLQPALDADDYESTLTNYVHDLKGRIEKAIVEEKKQLREKVLSEIKGELEQEGALFQSLKRRLGRNHSVDKIASMLVDRDVGQSLSDLTHALIMQKQALLPNSPDWVFCFEAAKQICGWLLINTVDAHWWFQQKTQWDAIENEKRVTRFSYALESNDYIEVIISRASFQPASYDFDPTRHKVKTPYGVDSDGAYMFDSISENASDEAFFIELYKALNKRLVPEGMKGRDLKDEVVRWARVKKTDENKIIYYLINHEKFDVLRGSSAFQEVEKALAGIVQFICCLPEAKSYDQSPCSDQAQILTYVANLLLKGETSA